MAIGGFGSRFKGGKGVPHAAAGGGFGSRFSAPVAAAPPPAQGGGHSGVLGFIENLGGDVGHAITGIPQGLVQTVEHPIRMAQQIGQSYKQMYGPLTHGDVGAFLHNLYEHPLGPIMDAATVLSLGAGAGAKLGLLPEVAREIELRSPAALAGYDYGRNLRVPLTGGPFQRAVKLAAHNAIQRVPLETPLVGETARFGRELRYLPQQQRLAGMAKMSDYNRAVRGLSNEQFAAMHLIGRGVHPTDYLNFLRKQGGPVEPTMLKVLQNPKIIQEFEHPSEATQKAAEAAQRLSEVDAQAKIARGLLTPETAAQRVGLHERMVYGIPGFEGNTPERGSLEIQNEINGLNGKPPTPLEPVDQLARLEKEHRAAQDEVANGLYGPLDRKAAMERGKENAKALRQQAGVNRAGKPAGFSGEKAILRPQLAEERRQLAEKEIQKAAEANPEHPVFQAWNNRLDQIDQLRRQVYGSPETAFEPKAPVEAHVATPPPGVAANGDRLAALKDELAHAQAYEHALANHVPERAKFYVPDVIPGDQYVANAQGRRMGGGLGVAKLPGELKYNKGVLARTGRLALHPDLLGPAYLRTLKYGLFDDIHSELMASAVRLDRDSLQAGRVPPKGWVFLRKKLVSPKTGNPRPQTIDHYLQTAGQTKGGLNDLVDHEAPDTQGMKFIAETPDGAERVHGDYLVIPERLAKEMAGQFHRSNEFVRNFIEKPTNIWRSLVLGGRVGFLTNFVVGNHLFWAMHAAGPEGLKSYLNAVRRVKGPGMVQSLLKDKSMPPAMRQEFMANYFPEQAEGTFGKTQSPGIISKKLAQTKIGRSAQRAALGVMPATMAMSELNLRRSLVEFYIRKSPEFKQVVKQMPRETRDFEAAAAKLIRGEGGAVFQRRISMQVDHSLGNFLTLGPLATLARGVFPFAAWYKAVLSVAGHLAFEAPGRTSIMLKIGQIGTDVNTQELGKSYGGAGNVPSWMPGSVMALGNSGNVMSDVGINPFQTVVQAGKAGGAALGIPGSGSLGQAFSQMGPNPVVGGAVQAIAGKNLFTNKNMKTQGGLLGSILSQTVGGLPEVGVVKGALGAGPTSATYGKQSQRQAILQYLGVPIKHLTAANPPVTTGVPTRRVVRR